ncbi:MAG: CpsD/CapB family tyrosine-protein kinase [Acidobacteria bacterium]|nr:CpsD/CapB family tyrosine-protein kinase [Acidobacteriota bacterium]
MIPVLPPVAETVRPLPPAAAAPPPVPVREEVPAVVVPRRRPPANGITLNGTPAPTVVIPSDWSAVLAAVEEIPYDPFPDAHLIDATRPHEAPTEEFRTLRTKLNHIQTQQPIHSLVVTSPSPAEGKSMAAANLALAQSQLAGNMTLLCDFDFRRPNTHSLFRIDRSPGITDFLLGKAPIQDCIKRFAGTNLYVFPAGEAVINPLELLNLKHVRALLAELREVFNWVILDSPPLLFAADANLLSTMCDGTILVVRIGSTTIDSITRAMQSLCENNVLGIVVNGARRGELYSKYTYYHSYYYSKPE